MTIKDKLALYNFKGTRRRNAWSVLTQAIGQGKDIDKLQLVVEPDDRISYMERK